MLIDTHVHLTDNCYKNDLEKIVADFKNNNLEIVINVGYDFLSSREGFTLSQNYENIYVALGVHPYNAKEKMEEYENFVRSVSQNKKVVAIGEIGLDYYKRQDEEPINEQEKTLQKEVFIRQLKLADELNLPIIIHVRDAYQDVLDILKEYSYLLKNSGVMHCYSGSLEYALEVMKLGLYFGFDGPITFKNSHITDRVLQYLPLNKVLIETDCPYLTPHPYRGQRNEPKFVGLVAKKMAETFNIKEEELIKITNANAKNLFKKLKA